MKIAKIELFKVPPRWLFLKMTTDDGLVGWGEPVCEGKADTVAAAVKELGDALIGHSATDIEDAFQQMYRTGFYRGGPILTSAISGIEQAMWDIKGKALGVPVYDLLGGKCRDRIEVYRWIGGDHPRDTGAAALEAAAQGYHAVKMNGTDELRWIDTYDKLDATVERVAAIREAVPDMRIAVDFHGRVHKTMAKQLMTSISGELLDVISHYTILSDAVQHSFCSAENYDAKMTIDGAKACAVTGLGRAAFSGRILNTLGKLPTASVQSWLLGAVLAEDAKAAEAFTVGEQDSTIYVAGKPPLQQAFCDVLETLTDMTTISVKPEESAQMGLVGALMIAGC